VSPNFALPPAISFSLDQPEKRSFSAGASYWDTVASSTPE